MGWLTDLSTLAKKEKFLLSFPDVCKDRSLGILFSVNDKAVLLPTLP